VQLLPAPYSPRCGAGFTLIELMVTVTVVGILSVIAVPNYREHVLRSQITEATQALADARASMEQHYLNQRSYVGGPCTTPRTVGAFTLTCSTTPTAEVYQVTATGSQSTSGFTFAIDHHGTRKTLALPSGWGNVPTGGYTCWIARKGQTC
jgi:prepilin-type N-terminal cleavage/methylation domain-containing protein